MKNRHFFITLIMSLLFAASCSLMLTGTLKREALKDTKAVTGNFTLISYGGTFGDNIRVVAILDAADDDYEFVPFAPAHEYTVSEPMSGETAFEEATNFVRWHHSSRREQSSMIRDENGRIIGYEVRPLYDPVQYGVSDVLDVTYVLKDREVRVYVRLKPHVKDSLETTGDASGRQGR